VTADYQSISTAAKVVSLSAKDYKVLVGMLVAALVFLCGISYAIAAHVVEAKAEEIKQSAAKIVAIERDQVNIKSDLINSSRRQDEILSELKSLSAKTNEIAVSVGTIQGRLSAAQK
jgi:hypothetical protein